MHAWAHTKQGIGRTNNRWRADAEEAYLHDMLANQMTIRQPYEGHRPAEHKESAAHRQRPLGRINATTLVVWHAPRRGGTPRLLTDTSVAPCRRQSE